ncbi:Gametotin-binding protein 2 [Hondaea fermentalgiana]|uniref:Gametotin-binding protein 2 n=1 Tax=Hondaea fermentalgiana TaxID=2315210 RepID=A0A2R5G032_9STRA|nr:Gametotin-binding protein 2 [Hondaea fermentalgiana]|eukprot:GBG24372.1 Gametotin-binding protein 2 [Hondaea fermentalgiana]
MAALQRGKRRAWFLHHEETQVVDFVLKSNQVPADAEIVRGLEQVSKETASKCMKCKKSDMLELITKYNQDIGCSGCVRQLRQSLEGKGSCLTGLMGAIFEEYSDDTVCLSPRFQSNEDIGKVFAAFNSQAYFSNRKGSKRQRCPLHAANPRMDEPWIPFWDEIPDEVQENIARLDVHEMSDQLTEHLKQLYFCRDCRGNVLKALDLLVGFMHPYDLEDNEDDEYAPEYFRPFLLGGPDDTFWTASMAREASSRRERRRRRQHRQERRKNRKNAHADSTNKSCRDAGASRHESHGHESDEDADLGELDDVDDTDYPIDLDEYKVKTISPRSLTLQESDEHKHGDAPELEKPSPQEEIFSQSKAQREGKVDAATLLKRTGLDGAVSRASAGGRARLGEKRSSSEHSCDCWDCARARDRENADVDSEDDEYEDSDLLLLPDDLYDEDDNDDDVDGDDGDAEFPPLIPGSHLLVNLDDVIVLIQRAEEADARDELNRQSGGSSDRHAPTLKDGQMELLHCIGKVLLDRIRDTWIDQLCLARTCELLTWIAFSCMRTNLQSALQVQSEESLFMLLDSTDSKESKEKKKRKKKTNKKKKQQQQQQQQQQEEEAEKEKRKEELQELEREKEKEKEKEKLQQKKRDDDDAKASRDSEQEKQDAVRKAAAALKHSTPKWASPTGSGTSSNNWDQACEARLLEQLGAAPTPSASSPSLFSSLADGSPSSEGFSELNGAERDTPANGEGEGLTEDEIREAQMQLQRMMGSSSRAEFRENLRQKFYNLSSKTAH